MVRRASTKVWWLVHKIGGSGCGEGKEEKGRDRKKKGNVLGGDGLECPMCSKMFNNKYKLEFHVERCIESHEMHDHQSDQSPQPTVYIIDE